MIRIRARFIRVWTRIGGEESCSMGRWFGIHGWLCPRSSAFSACTTLLWESSCRSSSGRGSRGWTWCTSSISLLSRRQQSRGGASSFRFSSAPLLGNSIASLLLFFPPKILYWEVFIRVNYNSYSLIPHWEISHGETPASGISAEKTVNLLHSCPLSVISLAPYRGLIAKFFYSVY